MSDDPRYSILLLEDNPLDAELAEQRLRATAMHFDWTVVDTRDRFLYEFENNPYDLILADYSLPDFDGLSALKIVRAKYRRLPFIFVSGVLGEDVAVETMLEGATDYVLKNKLERLVPAVHRALSEHADYLLREKAEQELHVAQSALIRSEKLAAVGRLASSIAHEINNPLESVINLLFLAGNSDDMAQIKTYLETAEQELMRVSAITNQTLRFHRQSSAPKGVTSEELFESVLIVYQRRLVNSRIELFKRLRATESIECLDGEIRQVLNNLVGNAIDAMHATGGCLYIRSRNHVTTDGRHGVLLTVADSGPGMPTAVQEHVFEAFFTTKGNNGTGLGLLLSKEIVERHKGLLRFRSVQGTHLHGTVFSLFLPCQSAFAG